MNLVRFRLYWSRADGDQRVGIIAVTELSVAYGCDTVVGYI